MLLILKVKTTSCRSSDPLSDLGEAMAIASKRIAGLYVSLLLATLSGACAPLPSHIYNTYKLYPGPLRPASELVKISFGRGVTSFHVDGLRVSRADYKLVELLPGEHEIKIAWDVTSSWASAPGESDRYEAEAVVTAEFLTEIEYTVHVRRVSWLERQWWRDYRSFYLWIEDSATGHVVAGEKIP